MSRNRPVPSRCYVLVLAALATVFLALSGCTAAYTNASPPPPPQYYEPPPPDYGDFDDLSYYGSWIEIHPFGMVWRPTVVAGWRPYLHGHWEWTDWGWMWVSYEPFGWATYHYGYWQYDPGWGWIWIPGDEWSAVRVEWVYFDDYVCWTPLPPPGYVIADPWVAHSPDIWIIVHFRNFYSRDIDRYTVGFPRSAYKWKTPHAVRNKPPTVQIVERHINKPVRKVSVDVKNVTVGKKEYKKVILPPAERDELKSYKQKTEKKVFKPEVKKQASSPRSPAYKPTEKDRTKQAEPAKKTTPQKKQAADKPKSTTTKKKTTKKKG